ncbi:MAG TPA: anhydro-N-acetylmuramic acid kinase [bacterium]|nr:anhydro-N-acetylmuramic acid kinase [bacterium]
MTGGSPHGWQSLAAIRAKPVKRIMGLISGTSADGIAAALVDITDHPGNRPDVRLVSAATTPYPPDVRRRVMDLFTRPATTQQIASVHYLLGDLFADAALSAARTTGHRMETIDVIASHGQTVAHVGLPDPGDPWSRPATLQLGEAAVIAERTRRPVIADFRAGDIAAGGQAAPLVPYADWVLLGGPGGRIALNLGGISNITVLPAGGRREDVYAFDCGPANMVIDGLVRHYTRGAEAFDRDGARAARGTVDETMVAALLDHPFILASPPKTAGHEQFGRAFLEDVLARWGDRSADDLVATATAFAAEAIARNITRFVLPRHPIDDLVAAGGGVHNPVLMTRLARAVGAIRVRRIDEFGIPADAKEALAFALLGHAGLMGIPGNLPRATGARRAVVLGKWTWP